ncbi:MAG: AAA family ATPase [Epsilonproteobacteria bacterium]|nr:AAA family ATPase [Campylobacterota bacterium]
MISVELNNIFKNAVKYAKSSKHEYISIEHIFLSILTSTSGSKLIKSLGGDIKEMSELSKKYLDKHIPKIYNEEVEPIETISLSAVMNDMMKHVASSGKSHADVGDMLASISLQDKSYAFALLKKFAIERVDILEAISHSDVTTKEIESKNEEYPNLSSFSVELVSLAKEGKIDEVIGRTSEIDRTMQILCRRKKNNPLLVGEPGVGKTAIAEGLALKIANDDVPEVLKDSFIFALDLGAMISGTKYRGDFEKRLKGILHEISTIDKAILFIDEIHTIVGAGATSGGSMDAANLLKPALARGELKCIGATTFSEFRNHLDKDKTLSRRFAKVDIKEPSRENSFLILKGSKSQYEEFHEILFNDDALMSAIDLSVKYIHDRFLPDKAMDIIDETGAFYMLQGKKGVEIGKNEIEDIVAKMLNLPLSAINSDNTDKLKKLSTELKKRIISQDDAIDKLSTAIKRAYAGLNQPNKPIGSFLFAGPTGVGKSALAIELAKVLDVHFERLDMSEYMESHSVSKLVGAPPGYVGFEQGGLLTDMIQKHPHTVLLLDEIEKAHPELMNILLQVMDGAKLTDNNGNVSDFKNVILIMTSNLGTKEANVMGFKKDEAQKSSNAISKFFSPEFRNRLNGVINFNHLDLEAIIKIVDIEVKKLNELLSDKNVTITISKLAKDEIARIGYDPIFGARNISRVIDEHIKEPLSDEILFGKLKKGGKVRVSLKKDKFGFVFEK